MAEAEEGCADCGAVLTPDERKYLGFRCDACERKAHAAMNEDDDSPAPPAPPAHEALPPLPDDRNWCSFASEIPGETPTITLVAYVEFKRAARERERILCEQLEAAKDYGQHWEDECGRERGRNVDLGERIAVLRKANQVAMTALEARKVERDAERARADELQAEVARLKACESLALKRASVAESRCLSERREGMLAAAEVCAEHHTQMLTREAETRRKGSEWAESATGFANKALAANECESAITRAAAALSTPVSATTGETK